MAVVETSVTVTYSYLKNKSRVQLRYDIQTMLNLLQRRFDLHGVNSMSKDEYIKAVFKTMDALASFPVL